MLLGRKGSGTAMKAERSSPGRQKASGENFIPSHILYCTSSVYLFVVVDTFF